MSIKEMAYSLIDRLSEEQLRTFIAFIGSMTEMEDIPNEETLEAMQEVEDMKRDPDKYKGYDDIDLMFKELLL